MSISKEDKARSDRAYTHVDYGHARLGNRWLERSWSAFLGHTTSLVQQLGETEWVAARNDEYSLVAEGKTLGVIDFGEVEWSESLTELGATLVATHRHETLALRIEQTAIHEAPALLRSVTLMNHGTRAVEVGPIVIECLTLDVGGIRLFTGDFTRLKESNEPEGRRSVGAMLRGDTGLLFVSEGEGTVTLSAPESGACSVRINLTRVMAPSQRWVFGQSMIVAFEGDPNAALNSLLPDIQRRVRAQERLESKRASEDA